jgi:hypothetical protein
MLPYKHSTPRRGGRMTGRRQRGNPAPRPDSPASCFHPGSGMVPPGIAPLLPVDRDPPAPGSRGMTTPSRRTGHRAAVLLFTLVTECTPPGKFRDKFLTMPARPGNNPARRHETGKPAGGGAFRRPSPAAKTPAGTQQPADTHHMRKIKDARAARPKRKGSSSHRTGRKAS